MDAPWYEAQELTKEQRAAYRKTSMASALAKKAAVEAKANLDSRKIKIIESKLKPEDLMPIKKKKRLTSISMFSGCGGLDVGFDRAGFSHLASYEILEGAAQVIKKNKPKWEVLSGDAGNVRDINWKKFKGKVDVIHGGPPCQPFSMAGRQKGKERIQETRISF